ncbi:callose synthase 10 isoform X1 [Populus alba x Populus x berolinensis]|nr:callose synthase 10 isoform X1 [Populus alba x Populus x berolinensis]
MRECPVASPELCQFSLGRTTNIDAILQAADEIQDEDPNVARILCEQAYSMAQNLDPSSDGRGVLQFKTGLMSVIKQKLAKRDGASIDRNRDFEHLLEFYQRYKRRHRVDDIQREEQKFRESGNFSTANLGEFELRSPEMKKVFATLRALVYVMEALSKDADPHGAGRHIMEELQRIKTVGELTSYNIVPLEAPSLSNAFGVFPEVRGAMSAIRYAEHYPRLPADFVISGERDVDMFDLLEYVFGFQNDNVRNQRENVVLAIANAQSRLGIPLQADPKIDEKAINEVFLKVLDNYIKWCKYLRKRLAWNSIEAINRDRKLFLVSLYYLIWGEAANVRFLPECICYIFHHMAKELDAILDHGEANRAASCITESGSVSFLEQIICPIYQTIAAEAERNNNGKAAHSAWRNYDDFNEYFWSPACFELSWPMKEHSSFLLKPKKSKRTGKSTFVEHRTFLHIYRSFHRLWIFLALMFQALAIIAFNHGDMSLDTFKEMLSVGPSFAIMNFIESCLDVLLMFGAYSTARGMAISRLVIRFFWCGLSSVFVTYLYVKVLEEKNQRNSDSFHFRIYILVLGVYAALRFFLALMLKFPACHALSDMSDQSFFQFFKWIYQERYYVGRGLFEKMSDYCRYVLYWLVIFACKFTFAYFLQASYHVLISHLLIMHMITIWGFALKQERLYTSEYHFLVIFNPVQIRPLVKPTNTIRALPSLPYSWHDLISKNNNNVLTIASLWAPVVAIYIMDIHIWYTILSAVVGGVMGARARLGEIRSIEMVHKRFESFPAAFVKNLVSPQAQRMLPNRHASQEAQDMNKAYAALFAPFWNEIIKSLREEDYISNREMDLLSIPSNTGSLRLVQWPLFLLSSKILLAVDLALDCKDTQADLWNRISKDEYMAYAVQECYYSVEKILHSLVDGEGRLWVERIFREINNSILEGSLVITLRLEKLPHVLSRFIALFGLLIQNETPVLANGAAKAVYAVYEAVTHDLLSSDLREQLDTWNILARARNERRLFSRIEWPKDPEIKEQVKRLQLLLTVKDSAANIPKNLEARRRLEFFSNSLFMVMPLAKPVSEMTPFSVFTPYYSETVLYSSSELRVENEDGISILFYLQKIFPDEWENFLERIGRAESTGDADLQESSGDSLELRFWASYRGQTLARTVRGMMYYRRALMLQSYLERRSLGVDDYSQTNFSTSQGFELSREARAQADLKFTYVVSCQIYGQQKQKKAVEAADISLLLQRNEALRVAFIHVEESDSSDGQVSHEFYSKLVKADIHGKDQAVMEKVKEREEATEKPGQTECKYYLRTGGCKYGNACRFNHTREKTFSVPPLKTPMPSILELNFLGLPIRPGEKQCEFYMRNGSCKYGATCKYNHPDPMAVGGSDLTSAFVNGGTASLPAPSPTSVGSWSSPRALNDPTPFVPYVFSPTRLPSQSSEWNGYQGTLYPPERSLHPPPSYAMSNPATESNVYAPQQQQTIVDEFPERPGQQLCSYFMKFGDCKFKSNCKYHHPKNRIPKSPSLTLSDKGLPLRPDQIICSYYSRYGICKFGPACKFDHSIQPPSSGSCDDQHTAFGNSVTQEKARMAESGNGSDISVEQPV